MFDGAEGILTVDAAKEIVEIKVQGRDPVGLRGLLSGCLRSTIDIFDGVKVTNENLVCGFCKVWRSTTGLRRRIIQGRLIFRCENCQNVLPIEDLLPGSLRTSHDDDGAKDNYQLVCEWIKTPEKAQLDGKFYTGQQMAWRSLLSTYLRSFLPTTVQPKDSPPLLWLPQTSSTGWVSFVSRFPWFISSVYFASVQ